MNTLKQRLLTALLTAMVLASVSPAYGQPRTPNCYGLSVGIEKYAVSPLKGPIKDCTDTEAVFQAQKGKVFGGVNWTHLHDEQASLKNIIEKLQEWSSKPKAGDLAVLSLAGHGARDGLGWFFSTQDGQSLNDSQIIDAVARLTARGVKVLVVLDSCHSGAFRYAADAQIEAKGLKADAGIILIMGCMPQEFSGEAWGNGILTKSVTEGLAGAADNNGDGNVTLAEFRHYAHKRVKELTKLRQKGFTLPGVTREEQHAEVVHSLTIADSTVLTKAVETKPAPTLDNDGQKPSKSVQPIQTGPQGSTQKPRSATETLVAASGTQTERQVAAGSILGQWTATYKRFKNGRDVDMLYMIQLLNNGTYLVTLKDEGKQYRGSYQLNGKVLTLISENDRDELILSWTSRDSFNAMMSETAFAFQRVK